MCEASEYQQVSGMKYWGRLSPHIQMLFVHQGQPWGLAPVEKNHDQPIPYADAASYQFGLFSLAFCFLRLGLRAILLQSKRHLNTRLHQLYIGLGIRHQK